MAWVMVVCLEHPCSGAACHFIMFPYIMMEHQQEKRTIVFKFSFCASPEAPARPLWKVRCCTFVLFLQNVSYIFFFQVWAISPLQWVWVCIELRNQERCILSFCFSLPTGQRSTSSAVHWKCTCFVVFGRLCHHRSHFTCWEHLKRQCCCQIFGRQGVCTLRGVLGMGLKIQLALSCVHLTVAV